MKSSLKQDIKNLSIQISKLSEGTKSQDFYDLAIQLFEKTILLNNQNASIEKNSLKKHLDDNNLSFINEDLNHIDEGENQSVEPLIETIKDMIPEMPENKISSSMFIGSSDRILFERKDSTKSKNHHKNENKINDIFAKELKIDLNDRLAFIKNLFDKNENDYDETISKINLFNDWKSTIDFIENRVKPKYDSWNEHEEIEKRFLKILRKRFDSE
tara:strand:+ start:15200 stop:15844 length:645 start_codon:yes stop_codon:yes gene_type:complete